MKERNERNLSWEESRKYSGSSSLVCCLYKVTTLCMLIMYFAGNVLSVVARVVKIFSYLKISLFTLLTECIKRAS